MSPRTARRVLAFLVLVIAELFVFAWLRVPPGLDFLLAMICSAALALCWSWRDLRLAVHERRAHRRRVGPPAEWID